ncbi:FAD-dependent oxidoreductase [Rhodococcus ruber]|uniref:NAD(P)/FAD-dependent oxidoreductase n=1 Tax=Rhodococcus TaxID=1827 RepID=UPI0007CD9B51|nr:MULTISPECIES: FAD-dependent oxidoreductase [Rhodococcus]AWH00114.1 FAD-dependent oxidoreductase [Rhodococcus ruber]MCZ1071203.1 FAD-dependent oxidoreductase [Rhodococcus sp. A5(2022)]RQM35252.1 pyridine nucleotide-disulfide oxidoreductase [Rhodococcus ruber]
MGVTGVQRIVVVGAGLAGVRAAEELRRGEFDGEIVLIGDEPHLPYDRPPLSKEVVRGGTDDTTLRPREFFDEQRIELRLGVRARELDPATRTLALSDGQSVGFDELIIATGLRPRPLPGTDGLAGVHVLRSLDDSRALRAGIVPGGRALIVGAGFIGCEVAASLRGRGMDVVLVEPQATPLASVLGERVGALVARLHTEEGVEVRTGVGVREVRGDGRVTGAVLGDGTELDVDVVVVGIGSVPVTDWLDGSGVRVDDGVVCDGVGRTSVPHVWAVGDVAAWEVSDGRRARLEHWTNAGEQAKVLAGALLGSGVDPVAQVPYFWSDQYDVKIQALGAIRADDTVHVVRDDGRKFLAYYERDGRLTGVVGAGLPGQVMKMRGKIAAGAPITEILAPTS